MDNYVSQGEVCHPSDDLASLCLILPMQTAFDPAKNAFFEDLSFSPAHSLAAHRPLGSVNRARLAAYRILSQKHLSENGKLPEKITSPYVVPA